MLELKDLKVGDEVIVSGRFCADRIGVIEKITPKGFIKVGNELYNYKNGNKRTSNIWDCGSIRVATPDITKKIKEQEFCRNVLRKLNKLTIIDYNKAVEINKIMEW